MTIEPALYAPISFFITLLAACLMAAAWRKRKTILGDALFLLMAAVTLWSAGLSMEYASPPDWKMLWAKVEFLGVTPAPVFFLLFTLNYNQLGHVLNRRRKLILFVIPALTIILAFTNEWHQLIWTGLAPIPELPGMYAFSHGPAFWLGSVIYSYMCLGAGTLLLLRALARYPSIYQVQTLMVVTGIMIPWVVNIIVVSGHSPLPYFDLTPFSMVVCCFLFMIAMLSSRLLKLVPVARDTVIATMQDGMLILDADNNLVDANPAARRLLWPLGELQLGDSVEGLLADWPELARADQTVSEITIPGTERKPGKVVEAVVSTVSDPNGLYGGRLIMLHDITRRKKAEQNLIESEEKYRSIFENTHIGIFQSTPDGRITEVNPSMVRMFGFDDAEELIQAMNDPNCNILIRRPEREKNIQSLANEHSLANLEMEAHRKDGQEMWLLVDARLVNAQTDPGKMVEGTCIDITESKMSAQKLRSQLEEIVSLHADLREQAIGDPLTGLYNRRFLDETLQHEISYGLRNKLMVSVVMMDIDHFKDFNDAYGHPAGDEILHILGEILRRQTRPGDIACRYGGDEFMVVMPGISPEAALQRANQWRMAFEKQAVLAPDQDIRPTLSGGVAALPLHGINVEDIVGVVDKALYAAKAAGSNQILLPEKK